jgi:hypothetical protein
MSFSLFNLVPAVYRLRDAQIAQSRPLLTAAELAQLAVLQAVASPTAGQQAQLEALVAKSQRGPLESLLMVIDEQLAVMAEDLDQLYDNQFIETCAPWVIPYIGDLIGYQSINGITPSVDNPRSEVAETISMRRRKGTVLVLEELARDVTGWGAHAVEYFKVLGVTQYAKHPRLHSNYAPDVRGWKPRSCEDSGFSTLPRRVDVRAPAEPGLPRPNLLNIGIYLWSLGARTITLGTPTPAPSTGGAPCYRFNSLGVDMQLYHLAISQGEQIEAAATPVNVPDALSRLALCADMRQGAGSSYYGEGASLALYVTPSGSTTPQLLNPYQIQVANLSGSDGAWINVPALGSPYAALIDPQLGRIALPPLPAGSTQPALSVSYCYGSNAEMGGGEYERAEGFVVTDPAAIFYYPDTASTARYSDIPAALQFVALQLPMLGAAALEITGSETIQVTASGPQQIDLPKGSTLEFRAQDGARPTVLLNGELLISGDASSTMIVNGIVLAAGAGMKPGGPAPMGLLHLPSARPGLAGNNLIGTLQLTHCTLTPGWALQPAGDGAYTAVEGSQPVLIAEPAGAQVLSSLSILGPVWAAPTVTVNLADSIVDATGQTLAAYAQLDGASGGAPLTLTGCTVIGKVHAEVLTLVSNSILWGALAAGDTWASALVADRLQTGCVRFSFLPYNAVTPRRFKCVEQALASVQPVFATTQYGQPPYAKLWACTDDSIRRGADDGGEMGGFHFVLAPLRESDLKIRLQEYLPVGLSAGFIYNS